MLFPWMAPALCLFGVHFILVQRVCKERGRSLGLAQRLLMIVVSAAISLVVGAAVGIAVWFGPAYLANDFIGIPWFTMLPAFGLAFLSWLGAAKVSTSLLVGKEKFRAPEKTVRYVDW